MRDCERPHPFSKLTAAVKKCAMAIVENAPATQQTTRLAAWIESCVVHTRPQLSTIDCHDCPMPSFIAESSRAQRLRAMSAMPARPGSGELAQPPLEYIEGRNLTAEGRQ